ncbi:SGNH/GDSL hydrolase family protein [Bradyrhizobium sp.]|uniref:SGNH/GDSL hydrolase family protein n=1 Tax=Bradyrhizobium sp. TaxID=376 RepID=UPI003C22C0E2
MRTRGITKANVQYSVLAVLAIAALAAGISYFRKDVAESHRHARLAVLYYTFSRFDAPIIILGDSITEASTLPRSLCDHPIVNAGFNGASTTSDLGTWLLEALDGRRAAAILVALGTNDALPAHSAQAFEANYASLLAQLKTVTDHLAVLGIPAIEMRGRVTAEMRNEAMGRIDALNAILPAVAEKAGAAFVALPPMPTPHTIDAVHLDAAGYAVWDAAVLKWMSGTCSTR